MDKIILKGRKVIVNIKMDLGGGKPELVKAKGIFHVWGFRKLKDFRPNATPLVETIGICELPDGRIRMVQPEKIQFIEDQRNG